jgi:hypothetical protein
MITDNGFTIVRLGELDSVGSDEPGQHCFVVRDPNNFEVKVTVQIGALVAQEIIMRRHGEINQASNYWTALAERHLTDYLWAHGNTPPDGRLLVNRLTPDDCDLALRWTV